MINRIKNKLNYLGFVSSLNCFLQTLVHIYYFFRFNLEKWHIQGGLNCSKRNPYVTDLVNSLEVNSVVDVGCGLGSILAKINCKSKLGVDYFENVVSAAKKINKNRDIDFIQGSFNDIHGEFDLMIACNFLHNYSLNEVKGWLSSSITHNKIRYLVLDEIYPNESGYKYKHKFEELLNNVVTLKSCDFRDEKRRIVLLKIKE